MDLDCSNSSISKCQPRQLTSKEFSYYARWIPHFSDHAQHLIKSCSMDDRACKAFHNLEAVTAFHYPDNIHDRMWCFRSCHISLIKPIWITSRIYVANLKSSGITLSCYWERGYLVDFMMVADTLSRTSYNTSFAISLKKITKNLPFYTDEVKDVRSSCQICAELKPWFSTVCLKSSLLKILNL